MESTPHRHVAAADLAAPPFRRGGGIAVLASAFLFVVVCLALFTPRDGTVDEVGLFNPVYTWATTGRMTYPAHYHFDDMTVHPPVRYLETAVLWRAGVPIYYAEAASVLLAVLVFVVLVLRARLPQWLTCGLIVGAFAPLTFVVTVTDPGFERLVGPITVDWFGLRPEGELLYLWLAGLVALEGGRLRRWDPVWLACGTALISFATTLHYYALPALAAPLVYGVGAWLNGQRSALVWMPSAAALVLVPFVAAFVIPNRAGIYEMITSKEGGGGVAAAVGTQLALYRSLANSGSFAAPWCATLAYAHVPAAAALAIIALAHRPIRWIVVSALPLLTFILLAPAKHQLYLGHEIALLVAGCVSLALMLLERFNPALPATHPLVALPLALVMLTTFPGQKVVIASSAQVSEMEIARAAGVRMLGPGAFVGGRTGAWYGSGAARWYGVDPDLLWHALGNLDVRQYASRFDALVEYPHMSGDTWNDRHATLSSWYLDGTLSLRGVFFARDNVVLNYVLLSSAPTTAPQAIARMGTMILRFQGDSAGDYQLIAAACPETTRVEAWRPALAASTFLQLPRTGTPQFLMFGLGTHEQVESLLRRDAAGCHVRDRISGIVSWTGIDASVSPLRRSDRPIRFVRGLDAAVGTR